MAARNPGVEFGKQMMIINNSLIVMRISVGDGVQMVHVCVYLSGFFLLIALEQTYCALAGYDNNFFSHLPCR